MVSDLSRLQTAQDEAVKPSTSSLDMGKFPTIPPHKGSWYNVVDEKYSQTPQVVPQAFSNIAKPGYRSGPPATVQQKELVKLEYMTRENISIANFLSTFGMASESCLNNLRVSRDQQEKYNLGPPKMHLFGTKYCSNSTKSHSKKLPRCNSCLTSSGAYQKPTRIWLQISSLLSQTLSC